MNDCPTDSPIHILHAHTVYSVLDGASTIDEYIAYAKDNGLGACGICDHGYALGLHELITKCNKEGIKPIAGIEFYLKPREDYVFSGGKEYDYGHISLWAQNAEGYKSLVNLATISWMPGRVVTKFGKPKPRITWEDLATNSAGIICGSGCIEGPIAKPMLRGEVDEAVKNAGLLKDIFGDRLYFEVMPHAVNRDFHKDKIVSVKGEDGKTYIFLETDMLQTELGTMTAKEACEAKVSEIFSCNPERHQDGSIASPQSQTGRRLAYTESPVDDTVTDQTIDRYIQHNLKHLNT
jgi:DNA polymerase III alpha subunit